MPRIFISYRRSGSHLITRSIARALEVHYGSENIFFDLESIEAGENFEEAITEAINQSDMMLVMIDPDWTTVAKPDGTPRIADPQDYVHIEVKTGLVRASLEEMSVVPVLIDVETMPQGIPDELKELQFLNARFLDTNPNKLEALTDNLVKNLLKMLPLPADDILENAQSKVTETRSDPDADKKSCFTTAGFIVGLIATLIGAFITVATFGFGLISEDQMNQFRNMVGITTPVPEATAVPETRLNDILLAEGNSTIERGAIRQSMDGVADNPQSLVIAPSQYGLAAWGYSVADSRLFALDIASGTPLTLTDKTYFDLAPFDNVLPASLHYDGTWLWLGDNRNHRLLAFDPMMLELVAEYSFGESGEPTQITQTGDVLWVSLRDTGEVLGLTADHETSEITSHCRTSAVVGESPYLMRSQGNTAVWVVYGRNADTAIRRITVTGCTVDDPIALDSQASGLSIYQDSVYVSRDNTLAKIENGALQTVYETDIQSIAYIAPGNGILWLATDSELLAFDTAQATVNTAITVTSPAMTVLSYGTQLWNVLENGSVVRYTIPIMTVNNAIGLVNHNQSVWIATRDGILCPLGATQSCIELDTENTITLLTDTTLSDQLWMIDDNNNVLSVEITTGDVRPMTTLAFTPTILELDSDGLIWLFDGIVSLATFDTQTQQVTNLLENSFNLIPPVTITHDGATTWFGYQVPDRISSVTFDDGVIRENPLATGISNLSLLTADSNFLYAIEAGTVAIVNTQSGAIINRYGISSAVIQAIVIDNELYAIGADGAIYRQSLD